MSICTIDFAYLIPVNQNNPLANTIRFTLNFNLGSFAAKEKTPEPAAPQAPSAPTVSGK